MSQTGDTKIGEIKVGARVQLIRKHHHTIIMVLLLCVHVCVYAIVSSFKCLQYNTKNEMFRVASAEVVQKLMHM